MLTPVGADQLGFGQGVVLEGALELALGGAGPQTGRLLGVINTLAMSVIERTREIGVARALGASRWQVRSTMLDEA